MAIPIGAFPLGPPMGMHYTMAVEVQVWSNWTLVGSSQKVSFPLVW